ncbi:MAG TPA: zinc metallopeptidase [Microvirga sp.]|jgi:Zn-dependent membrane protease YugP|nr:zinc metallopeptidase [Microvirga sp.]
MPFLVLLGLVLLLALIFGPQWWVRSTLRRHSAERTDFPGTGGELARHLLDLAGLRHVRVELAQGDHYDPIDKVVRLRPENHDGRSVTAVAVAAHEVAHALQDADGNRLIASRVKLAKAAQTVEVAAAVILATAPLVMLLVKSPAFVALQLAVVVALMASRLLVHLVTLPVELDASFRRALPILERGRYLAASDLPAARTVLRAAALTYVASALVTLLDVTRLLRVLRF